MEERELSTTISASPVNSESEAVVSQAQSHNNATNNMEIVAAHQGLGFASPTTTTTTATAKKKRGRPRKYDADGNLRVVPQTTPFSLSPSPPAGSASDHFSTKRGRGRPSGSANWQILASLGEIFASTAGGDFTPHVVTVSTGEDVAGKILSFAQKGPRGICVLSANGAVSNVTIRQPGSSGGILTYEGRFEILSLSGSYTVSEISGGRSRTGGLSVSLAGPDGRVIGGGLAGLLTAASPIQIVMGSFMPNGYKIQNQKRKYNREQNVASPPTIASDTVTFASPVSQAKPAVVNVPESIPTTTSTTTTLLPPPNVIFAPPTEQKLAPTSIANDNKENPNNGATINFASWNGSELNRPDLIHGHRSPDINISVSGD